MAAPVQCSPGTSLVSIFSHKADDLSKGIKNPDFVCYLQTPDNLKGNEPSGYPYFDFEGALNHAVALHSSVDAPDLTDTYTLILYLGLVILFALGMISGAQV